jgi:hypothetical protein
MRVDWNIGDWGQACGPRPSGTGAPGGSVKVVQNGNELSITGAGRNFSTTECWEQFPGLSRLSHSGGKRGWKSVCKTAAGDPRQATIITTLSATDNRISFDETGQYQFVIKGQNCTASARRTRTFTLVQREGEALKTPPTVPSATVEPPVAPSPAASTAISKSTTPARACAKPGDPVRLEVRPSRKLMRPGETFQFRALVVDEANCFLTVEPTWKLVTPTPSVRVLPKGKVEVQADAPEANIELEAAIAGKSLKVLVEVVSGERYEALLQQNGFTPEGESTDAIALRIATGSIGARSAIARDNVQRRRILFVSVIGGAALVLGLLGLWMARQGRAQPEPEDPAKPERDGESPGARNVKVCPTCREEYPSEATFCPNDGNSLVRAEGPLDPASPAGGVCPVCGHGYDPGVTVCPKHQEELVPYSVYAARRGVAGPVITHKICPLCGTQYPGDSEFCGKCGALLVPVN